ncbi:MAG: hypothetical protein ACJAZ2_001591 [Glaciecola sp.]|jgi:hypothetical protein
MMKVVTFTSTKYDRFNYFNRCKNNKDLIIMKKALLFINLILLTFLAKSQYTLIPDTNFEKTLISKGLDTGVVDGKVLTSSIDTVITLWVSYSSITDLTGIEGFTSLTFLSCYASPINHLDVSQNSNLEELITGATNITSIDLSNNLKLKKLDDGKGSLTCIDLSSNNQLTEFRSGHNLEYLNIKNGNNVNMTWFSVSSNPSLTCINVDDVSWATTNWVNYVDNVNLFSENCQETCGLTVSIDELSISNKKFTVFPSPMKDYFQINSNSNPNALKVSLYDLNGSNISNWEIVGDKKTSIINLTKGVYIMEIRTKGGLIETHRIIKQ